MKHIVIAAVFSFACCSSMHAMDESQPKQSTFESIFMSLAPEKKTVSSGSNIQQHAFWATVIYALSYIDVVVSSKSNIMKKDVHARINGQLAFYTTEGMERKTLLRLAGSVVFASSMVTYECTIKLLDDIGVYVREHKDESALMKRVAQILLDPEQINPPGPPGSEPSMV